jgi:DNA-binding LytR/AlgR family response regulator
MIKAVIIDDEKNNIENMVSLLQISRMEILNRDSVKQAVRL